jgi:hypothetical protein
MWTIVKRINIRAGVGISIRGLLGDVFYKKIL